MFHGQHMPCALHHSILCDDAEKTNLVDQNNCFDGKCVHFTVKGWVCVSVCVQTASSADRFETTCAPSASLVTVFLDFLAAVLVRQVRMVQVTMTWPTSWMQRTQMSLTTRP